MAWYWWLIGFILGLVILLGLSFLIGYVMYIMTKKLIEKRYKPQYDRGRRLPTDVNHSRPSQPRYLSPISNHGNTGVVYGLTGHISNVERIKRAFRKA